MNVEEVKSHIGCVADFRAVYMLMCYECSNGSVGEMAPLVHAAAVRPARFGVGLGFGGGPPAQ